MSFRRYEKYKDSGIEWLGDMPEHWQLARTKSLFELMKRPPREEDEIVTAFRNGEVTLRSNKRTDGFTNALQEIGYQGIRKGDLVIHAMDAFAGAIGVSDSEGKSTPVYSVCRPCNSEIDVYYYGLLFRYIALSGYISSLSKGVRERSTEFRWSEAGNVCLPLLPLTEQIAIATFLGQETAKIDDLIAEQQRLIELLNEKRQVIISHAVTRGLDPNVPLKNSGIEWLGEIPEHWELHKLKFLCDVQTGDKDTIDSVEDGRYPFFVRSQIIERINSFTYDCEAVLTAGDGAGVGKVFHYHNGPFDFHQRVYMLNNFRKVSGRFVFHYLKENFYKVALEGGAKSTVDSLRMPLLLNFVVAVPPCVEQEIIIKVVEDETAKIDELTELTHQAITLLQERRTTLIAAAVTGKIDVRHLVNQEAS